MRVHMLSLWTTILSAQEEEHGHKRKKGSKRKKGRKRTRKGQAVSSAFVEGIAGRKAALHSRGDCTPTGCVCRYP